MITRIVKMNFRPEEVENFLTIFHQSKDKIRHMPGCKHLELWNSQSDASIYYTYSIWDSEDDLNNCWLKSKLICVMKKISPLLKNIRKILLLEGIILILI